MHIKKYVVRLFLLSSLIQLFAVNTPNNYVSASVINDPKLVVTPLSHTKHVYVTRKYKEVTDAPMTIYYNSGGYTGVLSYDYMEYNRDLSWHVTYSGYVISGASILPTSDIN